MFSIWIVVSGGVMWFMMVSWGMLVKNFLLEIDDVCFIEFC